jgi:hypothetical protein
MHLSSVVAVAEEPGLVAVVVAVEPWKRAVSRLHPAHQKQSSLEQVVWVLR